VRWKLRPQAAGRFAANRGILCALITDAFHAGDFPISYSPFRWLDSNPLNTAFDGFLGGILIVLRPKVFPFSAPYSPDLRGGMATEV
jgi:hypothetical protein